MFGFLFVGSYGKILFVDFGKGVFLCVRRYYFVDDVELAKGLYLFMLVDYRGGIVVVVESIVGRIVVFDLEGKMFFNLSWMNVK